MNPKILLKNLSLVSVLAFHAPVFALSSDGNLPFHFKSNSIIYNGKQHTATYIGHVRVTQGTTRIRGNKLVVQYGKNGGVKKMIDTGNLAHYSTLPDRQSKRLYAQAKKITYNPTTKIVLLEQHAKVTQEKNIFTGPHIWYDSGAGVVRTTPKKNQKTVIIIEPQDK